jgi:uncharacterized protein with HEPN domain
MSQLELLERKTRLWHIEQSASAVVEYVAGRSWSDYQTDRKLRAAIEREMIIIGEAMRRALEIDRQLVNRITDVDQIVAFRNQLVHNYPNLDQTKIWKVIQDDLPLLLTEVRAVLAMPDDE